MGVELVCLGVKLGQTSLSAGQKRREEEKEEEKILVMCRTGNAVPLIRKLREKGTDTTTIPNEGFSRVKESKNTKLTGR